MIVNHFRIGLAMLALCACGYAQSTPAAGAASGGTGPYPAIAEGDSGLPTHTIYRPSNLDAFGMDQKLPVVAWANGACMNSSKDYDPFLTEIASHGFLVVAIGPYNAASAQDETKSSQLLDALNWATAENARKDSKYYQKVDSSKFAVMGHSCGGLQAMAVSSDPRVTTTVMWNSGTFDQNNPPLMEPPNATAGDEGAPGAASAPGGPGSAGGPAGAGASGATGAPGAAGGPRGGGPPAGMKIQTVDVSKDDLKKLHGPILYVGGGSSDIAYANMMDDFEKISQVPVFVGNRETGHLGTYSQPNGGPFGVMGVAWLKWQLKDDQEAKKMFARESCGFCKAEGWTVKSKNLK
jgi:hypothetical protein